MVLMAVLLDSLKACSISCENPIFYFKSVALDVLL